MEKEFGSPAREEQSVQQPVRYPPESTALHRAFRRRGLTDSSSKDDDARAVLLFVRLRSLFFALCPDHPVVLCETCHRAYTPEQLGTGIGNGCYLCRDCGADLRESLITHARTCPNLTPAEAPGADASVTSTMIPPASERFAARRRMQLEQDGPRDTRVNMPRLP